MRNIVFRFDDSPGLRAAPCARPTRSCPARGRDRERRRVGARHLRGRREPAGDRGRGARAAPRARARSRVAGLRAARLGAPRGVRARPGSLRMRAAQPVVPADRPTQPSLVDPTRRSETASRACRGPAAELRALEARAIPFAQGPSARVLLVDDDRDIREVVGAMLDAVGLDGRGGDERRGGARARARPSVRPPRPRLEPARDDRHRAVPPHPQGPDALDAARPLPHRARLVAGRRRGLRERRRRLRRQAVPRPRARRAHLRPAAARAHGTPAPSR